MDKNERHAAIVEDLEREPALRVNELARRYDVSSETIRRDLAALTHRGLINRTYGGAMRVISHEPALSEREHIRVSERELIARMAVDLVESDDVLMVGGGITTRYFAKALALFKGQLTVITPSFHVALALGTCENISVLMLPGTFNGHEGLVQGADAMGALNRYRASKAFLGASALSEEGPSDAAIPAGQLYQTMLERALHTYVLADSSKFHKEALFCYAHWQANISVVTDARPNRKLDAVLRKAGTSLILPGTLPAQSPI